MSADDMLKDLIKEEIEKIEQSWGKVKSKTLRGRIKVYTIVFGMIFAWFMLVRQILLALIVGVVFLILVLNTNRIKVYMSLAKQSPDTPIEEIIKGDMIW